MNSLWTDEHSQAVAAAAPVAPRPSPDRLDRLWATVDASTRSSAPDRRRRIRTMTGAALLAASLTVGGVATAAVYSAHTGRFPSDAEDVRLGGPGEELDPSAPDYGRVIAAETQDIPFPSQAARDISRADLVKDGQREQPGTGSVSTGAMRLWTAQAAVCSWSNEWAAARAAGDPARTSRASRTLTASSRWPAITDVDPQQTIAYKKVTVVDTRTGVRTIETLPDNTEAGYLPLLIRSVRSGDVDAVGRTLARWVYCIPGLMPDLPQAVPGS
ncbi:MAG: hypothetical protein ABWY58_06245 [Aeromicrobium sp.]